MTKEEVLQQLYGYASFRPGQAELIDATLAGRDVFGIMPTGRESRSATRFRP